MSEQLISFFASYNPATGKKIWEGPSTTKADIEIAVNLSLEAFESWSKTTLQGRISFLKNYETELKKNHLDLALLISEETGKPLYDAKGEVTAMINKIDISIKAYLERSNEIILDLQDKISISKHKPHGVVAVFGPYNFPGHLPNGHIVPALLAGNTCLFKPSELTPLVALKMIELFDKAGFPKGVIQLILGGSEVGKLVSSHKKIKGLFFTGSFRVGELLTKKFAKEPGKILALEMGGNNPLIVHEVKNLKAAVYYTLLSAFLSSGQRCTCARRLIVPKGKEGDAFIATLIDAIKKIKVGSFDELPEPFMGPVISLTAAEHLLKKQEEFLLKGAIPLLPMKQLKKNLPFLTPGLIDVTPLKRKTDEEIFGPLLQLIRVKDFKAALSEANKTQYGLSAGLLSDNVANYTLFCQEIRAGVLSYNTSTTGASSLAPFGGIGKSGNFRPSGYYAADYVSYPVASLEAKELKIPTALTPGIENG